MPRRTLLLAAAVGTALAAPSAAQAANACRAHGDHAKVVAESNTALVWVNGPQFKRFVRACTFAHPRRVYRLPQQDGGNALHLGSFRLSGRYLAYVVFDAEEASPTDSSYVHSVDLVKRRTIVSRFSGVGNGDQTTNEVSSLVLGARGSVAWANFAINLKEKRSVRMAGKGTGVKILDHGNAIKPQSLALGADQRTVYWKHGAAVKTARLP